MEPFNFKPPGRQTTELPPEWHAEIIRRHKKKEDASQIARELGAELGGKTDHAQIGRFITQYEFFLTVKDQQPRYDRMRDRVVEHQLELDEVRLQMKHLSVQMDEPTMT